MITIYIVCFNEVIILPHTVRFYRKRFRDCKIVVVDNFSTDRTAQLAKELGCSVMQFYTDNQMSDQALILVKNNCWKNADTNFVIVIDADEWLDIWPEDLEEGNTIIRCEYINMVNMKDDMDIWHMSYGVRYAHRPGKFLCFNKMFIKEMNYGWGCHTAVPVGQIVFSEKVYPCYHYKYFNVDYLISRYKLFSERMSDHNKKYKLSFHYLWSARKIRKEFNTLRKQAKKITGYSFIRNY